jgi:hypothetical protein
MSPIPSARSACNCQQPDFENVNTEPHSSPGRVQFEPPCASIRSGRTMPPSGALAASCRSPRPLIRQTIFVSLPTTSPNAAVCGSAKMPDSSSAQSVPEPRASRVIAFAGEGGKQPGAPGGVNVDSGYGATSTRRVVFLKANLQMPGNTNEYLRRQNVRPTRRSRIRTDVRRGVVSRTMTGPVSFPRTRIVAAAPAAGEAGVTARRGRAGAVALAVAPMPMTARTMRAHIARRMIPFDSASSTPSLRGAAGASVSGGTRRGSLSSYGY